MKFTFQILLFGYESRQSGNRQGGARMSRTFAEMEGMYREIVKRFHRIELQDWRTSRLNLRLIYSLCSEPHISGKSGSFCLK